jgi:hypothetical protein
MWVVQTIAESVCLIFGSLAAAIFVSLLLWHVLQRVHHPEFAALVIGAVAIVFLFGPFQHHPFLRLTLLFALAGTVPLWIAGREWRAKHKEEWGSRVHRTRMNGRKAAS